MKIFALGGVPCSGKTTLAKQFIKRNLPQPITFKFKKLYGFSSGDLIVLGLYDDERLFSGTDRLSMAVQPDFLFWIKQMKKLRPNSRIFFEGDRLFTANILQFLLSEKIDLKAVILDITEKERLFRKSKRQDNQSESFISSRRTKYENILKQELAVRIFHENPKDSDFILNSIESFLTT
jgi:uridine kinase